MSRQCRALAGQPAFLLSNDGLQRGHSVSRPSAPMAHRRRLKLFMKPRGGDGKQWGGSAVTHNGSGAMNSRNRIPSGWGWPAMLLPSQRTLAKRGRDKMQEYARHHKHQRPGGALSLRDSELLSAAGGRQSDLVAVVRSLGGVWPVRTLDHA